MRAVRRFVVGHGWWVGASLVVALVVGLVVGAWVAWLVYAVFNAVGLVLYVDGLDVRRARLRRRARILEVLAIVLVPVGVVGVLFSKGSQSLGTDAMGDESVRKDAAWATGNPHVRGSGF